MQIRTIAAGVPEVAYFDTGHTCWHAAQVFQSPATGSCVGSGCHQPS